MRGHQSHVRRNLGARCAVRTCECADTTIYVDCNGAPVAYAVRIATGTQGTIDFYDSHPPRRTNLGDIATYMGERAEYSNFAEPLSKL
jgi:hypothetical protein